MDVKNNKKGWVISLIGSLFFFYAVIQANVMTPLSGELIKEFNINSSSISLLSASYFYANIIFIIPAGLMLDRFKVRNLMVFGMAVAIFGTFLFMISQNIFLIFMGRFFCGIMMAFGLVACLKLASLWINLSKMALASSIVITIGMFGGIFAQIPIAYLVKNFGWRNALLFLSILGFLITIVLWVFVKNPNEKVKMKEENLKIKESLKEACSNLQNWYCGFFISLLNLPLAILGALFGISYLMEAKKIAYFSASKIVSMLFIGMIIGSPIFGWFSDYIKRRKIPMYIGSFLCLSLMIIVLSSNNLNLSSLYFLFLLIGFTSSSQALGYPIIAESNSQKVTATALSLAAFLIMGLGYGVGLPFVGWLLDLTNSSYNKAFLTIPLGIFISLVMAFLIKETRCKPLQKELLKEE